MKSPAIRNPIRRAFPQRPARALAALLPAMFLLLLPREAAAATVISKSANTAVFVAVPFAELEFENPLAGTEKVLGHPILQWRDADYRAGAPPWYDDWSVSHPAAIDGNANEIWLRQRGHRIWTTNTVPSTIVSVHLTGDMNDGIASVLVDGVEVAQLNMHHAAASQTALVMVYNLANTSHVIQVDDLGPPSGMVSDDLHVLGAAALGPSLVKWDQPPVMAETTNTFYGWNQISMSEMPPLAADDWVCTSAHPVTKIRWWGSFIGWRESYLPQPAPSSFRVAFWSDKPAGGTEPFSHPDKVLQLATITAFTVQWVGWDYDPVRQIYESCFLYEAVLPQASWFYQDPGPTGTNIYWLSLSAGYPTGSTGPLWGWKTRPRDPLSPAPDAAVQIDDPFVLTVGQSYVSGHPLQWPAATNWWDLAFELISDYDLTVTKYEQPPELPPNGIDVNATYNLQTFPRMTNLLADDFRCTRTGALTQITIWASWYQDEIPPAGPTGIPITLSIHTNIPVGPNNWSIPGQMLWLRTFGPNSYSATVEFTGPEGWLDPTNTYNPFGDNICWRYDFTIPSSQAFVQRGTPTLPATYWLDVQADLSQFGTLPYKFGWKTSPLHWMDNAVWFPAREPYNGVGWRKLVYPTGHPKSGNPLSMAFRISTTQPITETKWSQPPYQFQPPDAYNGWNQPSLHGGTNLVADDWVCTNDWPVTDIHWWGSFVNWGHWSPPQLPTAFIFTFWTDVPAGPTFFSHPGVVLHQVRCTNYTWSFVGWDFDPRDPATPPEACFKFEQEFMPDEWFHQEPGTNIYWVSIGAQYPTGQIIQYPWGWKTRPRDPTSLAPDDAINILSPTAPTHQSQFGGGYPIEFPQGVSWDTAFTLTTREPEPAGDFGDAPDRPYPTYAASGGASHTIVPGVFMGVRVDGETDGQPNANATGDDNSPPAGVDDEDGVTINGPLLPGHPATVTVVASVTAYFSLWIDYNGDGSWLTAGDQVFNAQIIPAGTTTLNFVVPMTARGGTNTFARARFCRQAAPIALPTGSAPDGEVEDYATRIEALDYGDAPDPTYPTLYASNGARHIVAAFGPGITRALGNTVDTENNGQPDAFATGDDLNPPLGVDDEDGVQFITALMPGVPNTILVTTTVGGYLQGFFDLNADGWWNNTNEHVIVDRLLGPGVNPVTFTVPFLANAPRTFARFRLSSQPGLGPTGLAPDGEVEDYEVRVQPIKWLQPPEVGSEGVDVNNVHNLADDFQCTQSGPVTDLHIWGSFYRDSLPPGGPTNMGFVITIFADVPRGPNHPYSHPGQALWTRVFQPGTFDAGLCTRTSDGEWWHDPATPPLWLFPGDTNIYQFDFYVPASEAFRQIEGTIYWLGVKYINSGPGNYQFGWKTTWQTSWNDDACWFDTAGNLWRDLHYQSPHPRQGESMDLAFAISTDAEQVLDFGDAPDSLLVLGYPTFLTHNGARHMIRPGMFMGALIDAEGDGLPNANATGDDNNAFADEDGVVFLSPLVPGLSATVQVTASAAGWLSAWLDFNADRNWTTPGDQIFADKPLSAGINTINFMVPNTATPLTNTFARFRFSTATNLTFTGAAPDGEVEDYQIYLRAPPESDLGDAPDASNSSGSTMSAYPGVAASFPTVYGGALVAPVGPLHQLPKNGAYLGSNVSGEQDADTGIDMDGVNNLNPPLNLPDLDRWDDGVAFPLALPRCRPTSMQVKVNVTPTAPAALYLNVWYDWNRDGDWDDALTCPSGQRAPEWAVTNQVLIGLLPGLNTLTTPQFYCWHPSLTVTSLWMRASLSDRPRPVGNWTGAGGDGPVGGYNTGETEDYLVTAYDLQEASDFGDAPDPTYPTLLPNGAQHAWVPGFMLGLLLDTEPNGQPHPSAIGDDLNPAGSDDEDGVALPATLRRGVATTVNVTVTSGPGGGRLDAWVDYNRNGAWANLPPERVLNSVLHAPGTSPVTLNVPTTARLGPTFARFRLSSIGGLPPGGAWMDGEVEDYAVTICQRRPTTPVRFTHIVATNTVIGGLRSTVSTMYWLAESDVEYQVQATTTLSNAPACTWVDVGVPVMGLGTVTSVTETNLMPVQRYYRLVVPYTCP